MRRRRKRSDHGKRDAEAVARSAARFGDEDLLQCLELFDTLARSDSDRVERVVGDQDRHARLVLETLIKTLEQRATTGEHDATVHDVAGELGRTSCRAWS